MGDQDLVGVGRGSRARAVAVAQIRQPVAPGRMAPTDAGSAIFTRTTDSVTPVTGDLDTTAVSTRVAAVCARAVPETPVSDPAASSPASAALRHIRR